MIIVGNITKIPSIPIKQTNISPIVLAFFLFRDLFLSSRSMSMPLPTRIPYRPIIPPDAPNRTSSGHNIINTRSAAIDVQKNTIHNNHERETLRLKLTKSIKADRLHMRCPKLACIRDDVISRHHSHRSIHKYLERDPHCSVRVKFIPPEKSLHPPISIRI